MNKHQLLPLSLVSLGQVLWRNRYLIKQMTWREVVGRYKGSVLGLAWSFFTPVLMLLVYTFVFSVVFKAKLGTGGEESKVQFAFILFAGMVVHGLFAEVVNRAPSLIISNVNYVKKVIFPLEILTVTSAGAALFHAMVSVLVLLLAFLMFNGFLNWTVIFLPVVLLPLVILTLGIGWFLASLGVYLRDVSQSVGVITSVMMFLAPIFYPISAVPEKMQFFIMMNPLTFIIEQTRDVVIRGGVPNWFGLALYLLIASIVAWSGYMWFQKTRKGFADVL